MKADDELKDRNSGARIQNDRRQPASYSDSCILNSGFCFYFIVPRSSVLCHLTYTGFEMIHGLLLSGSGSCGR